MSSDEEDFATYGRPLDPLEERGDLEFRGKGRAEKTYLATDEDGRRRFHGAFTGGFSAGYFNTVGSSDGWKPQTFRSSRSDRAVYNVQSAFDFMDSEAYSGTEINSQNVKQPNQDQGEHGICPMSVQVRKDFGGQGEKNMIPERGVAEKEMVAGAGDILRHMLAPARQTTGVRLLVRMGWRPGREVGIDDGQGTTAAMWREPERKKNSYGLGYRTLRVAAHPPPLRPTHSKLTVAGKTIRGQAFGVGILEEEDEDIYGVQDLSDYDFSLPCASSDRQLQQQSQQERKYLGHCIDGFHIIEKQFVCGPVYQLPHVPNDFIPLKHRKHRWQKTERESKHAEGTRSAGQRAAKLNDVSASEISSNIENKAEDNELQQRLDYNKRSTSFEPFANDPEKQRRYETYLNLLSMRNTDELNAVQAACMTEWERQQERAEFDRASSMHRPLSSDMANRFTSGAYLDELDHVTSNSNQVADIIQQDTPIAIAAANKSFGSLTRHTVDWSPATILYKRFNVPQTNRDDSLRDSSDKSNKEKRRTTVFDFFHSNDLYDSFKVNDFRKSDVVKSSENMCHVVPDGSPDENEEENMKNLECSNAVPNEELVPNATDKSDLFKAIFLDTSDESDEEKEEIIASEKVKSETEIQTTHAEQTDSQHKNIDSVGLVEHAVVDIAAVDIKATGIFANLNLDLMKPKFSKPKSNKDAISDDTVNICSSTVSGVHYYGPTPPPAHNSSLLTEFNLSVDGKKKNKSSKRKLKEVWVEKCKKHKKKHKKDKKK